MAEQIEGPDLSPTQKAFRQSEARFRAMVAGVGSGKTYVGCLEALMTALNYPGSQGAIVASTFRALKDYVLPMIKETVGESIQETVPESIQKPNVWDEFCVTFNMQDMIATFTNGSTILFRSCDKPEALAGPNLSWFYIDEAAKVPVEVWWTMIARLRLPPEKGWITTTPRGRNWVWEEFAKTPRDNYDFFTGSSMENPHISLEYLESLEESYGKDSSRLKQDLYAEFIAWEGLVYPGLKRETHHLEAPEPGTGYKYAIFGVDWGWRDPMVILVGLVGVDNSIHIVEEFVETKCHIDRVVEKAKRLVSKWGKGTFYCDPSSPENIAAFRPAHLDAWKGNTVIDRGISEVSRLIETPGLFHLDYNACPETVNEFECYSYAEERPGHYLKDKPLPGGDHCMDCLRYLAMSHVRPKHASSIRGFR